jgi:cation diffusion facilitator CzcD-associated flavoprotein CzcO
MSSRKDEIISEMGLIGKWEVTADYSTTVFDKNNYRRDYPPEPRVSTEAAHETYKDTDNFLVTVENHKHPT